MPASIAGIVEPRACNDPGATSLRAQGRGGSRHEDERLTVVADASFHDHAELARRLGLPEMASSARLIAAAYRREGMGFIASLDGDFAFALLDRSRRELLCARDHFGIRPLYYAMSEGRIAFASSITELRRLLPGEPSLRDKAIADFVLGRVVEPRGTFFEGIERLPAAHLLRANADGVRLHRYWSLRPDPAAAREPAPAERFRDLFERAVEKRGHNAERPAALLSGGLDSSSIACIARRSAMPRSEAGLPTYSVHFTAPERCNERRFIDAVLEQGGFDATILERDGYRPFARAEDLLAATDGPVLSPNLACIRPLFERAATDGTDVLLDGHGGDEVVSHGYGRLDDLARSGSWVALCRETAAASDNYGRPTAELVRSIARRHRGIDAKLVSLLLRTLSGRQAARAPLPHLLRRDVLRSCRPTRSEPECPPDAGEAARHLATLTGALQPYAFEVLAHVYRSVGIEARFPFWDRALVEFCTGLPGSAKLSGGWSRLVLREAMEGVIPEMVRKRRDKVDFAHHLACGMVRHHDAMIRDLLADGAGPVGDYVDLSAARAAYEGLASDPAAAAGPKVQQIWRIVMLAIWLRSGNIGGHAAGTGGQRAHGTRGAPEPMLAGEAT